MEWIEIEEEEPERRQQIWVETDKGDIVCRYAGERRIIEVGAGFMEEEYRDFRIHRWKRYVEE